MRVGITNDEPLGREWKRVACQQRAMRLPAYEPTRESRDDDDSVDKSILASDPQLQAIVPQSENVGVRTVTTNLSSEASAVHEHHDSGTWLQVAPGGAVDVDCVQPPHHWTQPSYAARLQRQALTVDDKQCAWRIGIVDSLQCYNSTLSATFGDYPVATCSCGTEGEEDTQQQDTSAIRCQVQSASSNSKFVDATLSLADGHLGVRYQRGVQSNFSFQVVMSSFLSFNT